MSLSPSLLFQSREEGGDYASLYWTPGMEGSCAENLYEYVDDGKGVPSGSGSGSGVKAMRESLLRELRRDLGKFIRVDKIYGNAKDKDKKHGVSQGKDSTAM